MRRLATVRVRITVAAVLVVGAALVAGAFWLVRAHRDGLTSNLETAARAPIAGHRGDHRRRHLPAGARGSAR